MLEKARLEVMRRGLFKSADAQEWVSIGTSRYKVKKGKNGAIQGGCRFFKLPF